MRRNRPLAAHYPIAKPTRDHGCDPSRDGHDRLDPARQSRGGSRHEGGTTLSHTTSFETGASTLYRSPQPRRPSLSVARQAPRAALRAAEAADQSWANDLDTFSPPARAAERPDRLAGGTTGTDPGRSFYNVGSLHDPSQVARPQRRGTATPHTQTTTQYVIQQLPAARHVRPAPAPRPVRPVVAAGDGALLSRARRGSTSALRGAVEGGPARVQGGADPPRREGFDAHSVDSSTGPGSTRGGSGRDRGRGRGAAGTGGSGSDVDSASLLRSQTPHEHRAGTGRGFLTPPPTRGAGAAGSAGEHLGVDVRAYFAKKDVFAWYAGGRRETRARTGGGSKGSPSPAAAPHRTGDGTSPAHWEASSLLWGLAHGEAGGRAGAPAAASASASSSSVPASATGSSGGGGWAPRPTPHPYAVEGPRIPTHDSLFSRHRVKETRVLQSYLARRPLSPSHGPVQRTRRGRSQGKSSNTRPRDVSPPMSRIVEAPSKLSVEERSELRQVVEAAERATAALSAMTAHAHAAMHAAAPAPPAAAPVGPASRTDPSATPLRMAELMQAVLRQGAKDGAAVTGHGEGPCHSLIRNAGDPLVLRMAVEHLKEKAARLRGENEELWRFLSHEGAAVVGPRRRRRHKRGDSASHQSSHGSTTSSTCEGGSTSSSSSDSALSPSSAYARGHHHHRRARQARPPAQTQPRTGPRQHRSPRRAGGQPAGVVESIERTTPRRPPAPTTDPNASPHSRQAGGAHRSVEATLRTSAHDASQAHAPTTLLSPSLSSSTALTDGGQGHRGRPGQRSHGPPPDPEADARARVQERYSAEKDQLYSFMQSLEEEEEAAIRAGHGSQYGFDDAPFFTQAAGRAGVGVGAGSRVSSSAGSEGGSLRPGSAVGPPLPGRGTSRFAVPTHTDAAISTGHVSGRAASVNGSFSSRFSSASGRHHKHVQTPVQSAGWGGPRGDEGPLSEEESEYLRRWRHWGGGTRADLRPSSTNTSTAPPQEASTRAQPWREFDSVAGSVGEGEGSATGRRTAVITLHTSQAYTRRTVQRLQAYVDRLEDTRQVLREALASKSTTATTAPAPMSGGPLGKGPAQGVPPLYPHGGSGYERSGSGGGGRVAPTQAGRRLPPPRSYFRSPYADPEVDATLSDMEETDPIEVRIVLQDDGMGSVSKQMVDDGGGELNGSLTMPPSTVPSPSARSTPMAVRHRAGGAGGPYTSGLVPRPGAVTGSASTPPKEPPRAHAAVPLDVDAVAAALDVPLTHQGLAKLPAVITGEMEEVAHRSGTGSPRRPAGGEGGPYQPTPSPTRGGQSVVVPPGPHTPDVMDVSASSTSVAGRNPDLLGGGRTPREPALGPRAGSGAPGEASPLTSAARLGVPSAGSLDEEHRPPGAAVAAVPDSTGRPQPQPGLDRVEGGVGLSPVPLTAQPPQRLRLSASPPVAGAAGGSYLPLLSGRGAGGSPLMASVTEAAGASLSQAMGPASSWMASVVSTTSPLVGHLAHPPPSSSVMAIDCDEVLGEYGLLSSASRHGSGASLAQQSGTGPRGLDQAAAGEASPAGSPLPTPPRRALTHGVPVTGGRSSPDARSLLSPYPEGGSGGAEVGAPRGSSEQGFYAARSISPMSDTPADALTSP